MNRKVKSRPKPMGLEAEEAIQIAAKAASDKKAFNIVALDLRRVASFTDYFVICTGTSTRQLQTIADTVEEELRKAGRRPLHIEGYSTAEWILLDYGDFIVHAFSETSRSFYDLERLWRDAEQVKLQVNEDNHSNRRF
jgi:ribosome-associated protein